MTEISRTRRVTAIVTGLALFVGAISESIAQEAVPSQRAVVGFIACLGCHGRNPQQPGDDDLPLPSPSGDWILDNEVRTWAGKDKHHQAYAVLFNRRSIEIGRLMKISAVHRDRRCLSCHTGYPRALMPAVDGQLVAESWHKNTDVSFGITCEGCHGPGGDLATAGENRDGWFRLHLPPRNLKRPWRFMDPKVKFEQHGYVDVRTPSSKARLCGSCHIGDVAQGRVVTHEMYAAGHPPLPGFEVATFAAQMPVHWRAVHSKTDSQPAKSRSEFLARTNDPFFKGDRYRLDALHATQAMLVGSLVSLAQSLEVTAALSGPGGGAGAGAVSWPELAQFECYACHHDLRVPAWRQQRVNPAGVPGRPVLREWTTILAGVALEQDKQRAGFDIQWRKVQGVLAATPFGRKSELSEIASTTADWLMVRAQQLERTPLSRKQGRGVLLALAKAGSAGGFDYESSRQLVWACEVVYGELGRGDAKELKSLREAGHVLVFPQRPAAGVGAGLFEPKRGPSKIVEIDLAKLLPPIGNYDPGEVTRAFAAVRRAVEAWPALSASAR